MGILVMVINCVRVCFRKPLSHCLHDAVMCLSCFLDVNECGNTTCHHECENTIGSYFCKCNDGYVLLQDNTNCRRKVLCVNFPCKDAGTPIVCTTGEVRLVNGTSPTEGRVEVCDDGKYYTVCDDYWDELEARVVCTQLNFSLAGELYCYRPITMFQSPFTRICGSW